MPTMFSKRTKDQQIAVDATPRVRAAIDRLNELKHQLASTVVETTAAQAGLASANGTLKHQSQAFLDGDEGGGVAVSLESVGALARRQQVIRGAIAIQERHVQSARVDASRELATAARPEYEEIIRRMAAAIAAVAPIAEEEAAFRDTLRQRGVEYAGLIPPVPMESMRLDVYASRANQWFDQAEREYSIRPPASRRREP